MGFNLNVDISALTVFVQGLLSFFSPCVLPLLPMYFGYLSGGSAAVNESGQMIYDRKKVIVHTLFFVLGISSAFFLLGLGMTAIGQFFGTRQYLLARIGGGIVLLFGLYQLGILSNSRLLGREKRFSLNLDKMVMSPLTAFLLGFAFSFAWTPCVGPALSSVLIMAASASSQAKGFLLIGIYTLGFVLPFLAAGLFTTSLLGLFRRRRNIVRYTARIGGILMIFMGIMMLTGNMNLISGYFSSLSGSAQPQTGQQEIAAGETEPETAQTEASEIAAGETEPETAQTEASEIAAGETEPETAQAEASEVAAEEEAETEAEDPKLAAEETSEIETVQEKTVQEENLQADQDQTKETASQERQTLPAFDFELRDQYGEIHRLSDYVGKTVFLNFWATWCPPCRAEMPDIQTLYEQYQAKEDSDVVILGIAAPGYGQELGETGIRDFLEENGYTYPVVMDEGGKLFMTYYVTSIPTTYMIDKDGNVFGYVTGAMSLETMQDIIDQTIAGR